MKTSDELIRDFRIYPELSHEVDEILKGEYDIPLKHHPKTVLDIGANCGLFSLWASSKWPEAQITAYEPWPESVKMFTENFRDSGCNVTLIPFGVRNKSGTSKLYSGQNRAMCSFHDKRHGKPINVRCISAMDIPSAEFVKIDTEGSECEILHGLDLSETKAVSLEAHSSSDALKIETFLVSIGFAVHSSKLNSVGCWTIKFIRRGFEPYPQRLFVAVPYYGGTPPQFHECMARLEQRPTCHMVVRSCVGDSLVCRARNTLTAQFLDSDCSDMLFIDSDLIFSPSDVSRILSHDVGIVGGFYPKKQDGRLSWVCNTIIPPSKPRKDGLQRMRYMGTGFLRINRNVFEDMAKFCGPHLKYSPDRAPYRTEHDFWPVGPYRFPDDSVRYLSEDWYFCQRALDLGMTVFGDTRIILKHIGHATYPLQSQIPQIENPKRR